MPEVLESLVELELLAAPGAAEQEVAALVVRVVAIPLELVRQQAAAEVELDVLLTALAILELQPVAEEVPVAI
jgi:hypothetical protein